MSTVSIPLIFSISGEFIENLESESFVEINHFNQITNVILPQE